MNFKVGAMELCLRVTGASLALASATLTALPAAAGLAVTGGCSVTAESRTFVQSAPDVVLTAAQACVAVDERPAAAGVVYSGSAAATLPYIEASASFSVQASQGHLALGLTYSGQSNAYVSRYGRASTIAHASFDDVISVRSAGLADGTPVNIRVRGHFDLDAPITLGGKGSGFNNLGVQAALALGPLGPLGATGADAFSYRYLASGLFQDQRWLNGVPTLIFRPDQGDMFDYVLTTQVGAILNVTATLDGSAFGYDYLTVDAMDGLHLYLDADGTGFSLESASGHNYAVVAVPEPATWATLALGLMIVLLWRRQALRA